MDRRRAAEEGGMVRGARRLWLGERSLAGIWLALCLVLVAALALWGVAFNGAERVIDAWNARWIGRLERGEELYRSGRHEEAAAHLERLEGDFPAIFVKHRLDRERERLLELLGRSHAALGRKGRALAALRRLVEFDPRNFANHAALAEVAAELGEPEVAEEAYERALAILPSHLPSLRGLIELRFDDGRFADVVAAWERYLDAYLLAPMTLAFGGERVRLEVPADGEAHDLEAPVHLDAGWRGEVCLETGGYSVQIGELVLEPILRVGMVQGLRPVRLPGTQGWSGDQAEETSPSRFFALDTTARICRDLGPLPGGAARLRLELTAFKTLPEDVWHRVETSYRNLLADDALERARARSQPGGAPEAGSVFTD